MDTDADNGVSRKRVYKEELDDYNIILNIHYVCDVHRGLLGFVTVPFNILGLSTST